ncbi:MAG TPA: glycosyltransferase family 39 protein [Rhizomicrobium sp.]|nr:glycosyltransferase family 39 protein [Rhizomicrobium sp.]
MTGPEIAYAAILALFGGLIAYLICPTKRDAINVVTFFEASFLFRAALVALNWKLNFFVQKYLSDFSIGLMDQPGGIWALFAGPNVLAVQNVINMKFVLEAVVNMPAVHIFEDSSVMLNYTNAFIGAASALSVFAYLRRLFNERVATFGLLIASLYPAAINFSFFGLRDVFIYFFLLMNVFSFAWLVLRRDHRMLNWFIYIVSFVCCTIMRVTFIVFIVVPPGWFILQWLLSQARVVKSLYTRLFAGIVAAIVIAIVSGVGMLAGYFIVVHQVTGADTLVAPTVLFQDYEENRAARGSTLSEFAAQQGQGTNSIYLPLNIYQKLPIVIRIPLQLFAFIEIPLPWQLNAVSRILALFDTIFVVTLMWWAVRAQFMFRNAHLKRGPPLPRVLDQYSKKKLRRLSFAFCLAFVGAWFGFGVLVSDAGNAFRMRLSVVPFAVFGASIYGVIAMQWLEQRMKAAVATAKPPQIAPGE